MSSPRCKRNSNDEGIRLNKTELLQREHPEVLTASPRPGGYIKYLVPTRSLDRINIENSSKTDKYQAHSRSVRNDLNTSKQYRVTFAADALDFKNVDVEDPDDSDTENRTENTINLHSQLNVVLLRTLQTALLLGSGDGKVKDDMAITAYIFLRNIKDDEGKIPPNCHRLLNHLLYIGLDQTLVRYNLDKDGKPVPEQDRSKMDSEVSNKSEKETRTCRANEKEEVKIDSKATDKENVPRKNATESGTVPGRKTSKENSRTGLTNSGRISAKNSNGNRRVVVVTKEEGKMEKTSAYGSRRNSNSSYQ